MYFIIVENVFNAEKLIHANIITHARKMTVIVLFRDCRDGKNARKKEVWQKVPVQSKEHLQYIPLLPSFP